MMNKYFLLLKVYLPLIIYSSLYTIDIPTDHTVIECTITPIATNLDSELTRHHWDVTQPAHYSHPHIPLKSMAGKAFSNNWSGYVAKDSSKAQSVNAVSGSWVVPSVHNVGINTCCAIWVGIDGYGSPSVEQIGTSHDWTNGTQQNYAWFEMYPAGSYVINGFPLHIGDVISASVVYSGNGIFTLSLHNMTRKVSTFIPTSYTQSMSAKRESAEWVVEAPYFNSILPLSDFKTIYFSRCTAIINNHNEALSTHSWLHIPITMITTNGAPKAVPSSLGNGSFSVTWAHI